MSATRCRGRLRAALLPLFVAVMAAVGVGPVVAHELGGSVVPVVDGFSRDVEGVRASIQSSLSATLLTVEVEDGHEVEVLDERGEAWAVITADEARADVASAAFAAAVSPNAVVPPQLPAPVDPWPAVAQEGRLSWFEHRLHPGGLQVPDALPPGAAEVELLTWEVPFRVDGVDVLLQGRLLHVPVLGQVVARLTSDRELATGVTLDVVSGRVPGFLLSSTPDRTVVVLGRDGAPYVRLDAEGATVRTGSPTWRDQRRLEAESVAPDDAAVPVAEERRVSATPSHAWVDERAALPGVLPPADVRASGEEVVLRTWELPVELDGELVMAEGETVWIPTGAGAGAEQDAGSGPASEWLVAVGVGLVLLGVVVRRRRTT